MSYGGGGPQPVVLPKRPGGPPMRVPDRPPGRFTYLRERIVKWAAIFGVAFFIVVFVVVIAKDLGREPTQGELRATVVAEAARATRAAR